MNENKIKTHEHESEEFSTLLRRVKLKSTIHLTISYANWNAHINPDYMTLCTTPLKYAVDGMYHDVGWGRVQCWGGGSPKQRERHVVNEYSKFKTTVPAYMSYSCNLRLRLRPNPTTVQLSQDLK